MLGRTYSIVLYLKCIMNPFPISFMYMIKTMDVLVMKCTQILKMLKE